MGRWGKREFVQVLRLLETFSQQEVAAAAKDATARVSALLNEILLSNRATKYSSSLSHLKTSYQSPTVCG